jgi:hypothetical protein
MAFISGIRIGYLVPLLFLIIGQAQCVLEVIQAATPPRLDLSGPTCKQLVFTHSYQNSYGSPYVGYYTPPPHCRYTTTIFNLSVVSIGRQYDRLATLWLGDVEVWRTSTAMPTQTGIHWVSILNCVSPHLAPYLLLYLV